MNLNYLGQKALVNISDLEAVRYPTPTALVDASSVNQYFTNSKILFGTRVSRIIENLRPDAPARYVIFFNDQSYVFTNRVVFATGAGRPRWPRLEDDASNQILERERQGQESGQMPHILDYEALIKLAGSDDKFLGKLAGKNVHIVGGGASGYTAAEYLLGMSQEGAYGRSVASDMGAAGRPKISLADRKIAKTREDFLRNPWLRYVDLAEAFPTQKEVDAATQEKHNHPDDLRRVISIWENEPSQPGSKTSVEHYRYSMFYESNSGDFRVKQTNTYEIQARNLDRIEPIPARLLRIQDLGETDPRGRFVLTYGEPAIDETGKPYLKPTAEKFADYVVLATGYEDSNTQKIIGPLSGSQKPNPFKDPAVSEPVYYWRPPSEGGETIRITAASRLKDREIYAIGPTGTELTLAEASQFSAGTDFLSMGAYNIALPGQGPRSEAAAVKLSREGIGHFPEPSLKQGIIDLRESEIENDGEVASITLPAVTEDREPQELMTSIRYQLGAVLQPFRFPDGEILLTIEPAPTGPVVHLEAPVAARERWQLLHAIQSHPRLPGLLGLSVHGFKKPLRLRLPFGSSGKIDISSIHEAYPAKRR